MLSKAMETALNNQIHAEMESAYLYLAMAAYAEAAEQPGTAVWLQAQATEEMTHAMKFYSFIHDRGGRVTLQAIAQPAAEFGTMADLFQAVLTHEQKVTALIHNLYELATAEKDYASIPLLQWFIAEQVEEEKTAQDVLRQIKTAGGSTHTMLFIDRELGKRQAE